MPAPKPPRLAELRELLVDLIEGGVVITEPPSPVEGEQVAFRTLIQLDGDICMSIHAEALADPDFAATCARHIAHVREELARHTRALRRWVRAPAWICGALGFSLVYGLGLALDVRGDLASVVVHDVWRQLVLLSAATATSALFAVLARAVVRSLLRRTARP
ncbi:hypothetical protein ENSA5_04160 [Enhygromyxa salina]|uniref:Uncharacterized protein n=1 Tax=Enhygromyxa salina TaxID=215803 RepID=A0A2S9YJK9_9BACT|nr:hypothetical protein [Enhygromyxa salina]PRQ05297.1 hypothetical protein ENSA5_04160 [Enhygromyxa salina]